MLLIAAGCAYRAGAGAGDGAAATCEAGTVASCTTSCGGTGTTKCDPSGTFGTCDVVIDPATAWQISADATAWTDTPLPSTNWMCTNCTRYFRTTVCGVPTAVDFEWSSDNRARMTVDGAIAFETYWRVNYCTDAPCCAKCCDTTPDCLARTSPPQTLDATALALFVAGPNVVRWEVGQEAGGSGFYTMMTVRY